MSFFVLGIFGVSFNGVSAQSTGASIADVCGQGSSTTTACKISDIGPLVKGVLELLVIIGLPLLFIFVSWRFVNAWFALQQGNANAYKEALQKAGSAISGFIFIILLIAGLLYTMLSFFGIDPKILQILKLFSSADFFTHTYAQATQLPNFSGSSNLYDFILNALRLIMKFIVYPALIIIWVWTGFSFVLAQGAPDALAKAKKWLVGAFVTTLVIVFLQGFITALRASALKIIGTPAASSQAGESCKTDKGTYGRRGTDGVCY